ncbi:MAG: hypothetical protein NVS3B18_06190 [Candidatus Dormibacteria bacterium]
MSRSTLGAVVAFALVVVVVTVDLVFFRHRSGARLVVNIAIVGVFAGGYVGALRGLGRTIRRSRDHPGRG